MVNFKDMWAAVQKLTGRHQEPGDIERFTAELLNDNDHYAAISTDHSYTSPHHKGPANLVEFEYISKWLVFQILDHLCPTAIGLDGLPAWFLRLRAPIFFNPLLTVSISRLPQQPFRSSGSKLASYASLFHPNSMATSGPSPSHQDHGRNPYFANSSIQLF